MAKIVHLGCYIEFSHTHKTNFVFVKELFQFVAVLVCSLEFCIVNFWNVYGWNECEKYQNQGFWKNGLSLNIDTYTFVWYSHI